MLRSPDAHDRAGDCAALIHCAGPAVQDGDGRLLCCGLWGNELSRRPCRPRRRRECGERRGTRLLQHHGEWVRLARLSNRPLFLLPLTPAADRGPHPRGAYEGDHAVPLRILRRHDCARRGCFPLLLAATWPTSGPSRPDAPLHCPGSSQAAFVKAKDPQGPPNGRPFRLGFTFSFPCQQLSVNRGTLVNWTKARALISRLLPHPHC